MDVSFIIVNYNSAALLLDCIASIQQYTQDLQYEIIVVDNASPDRSIEAAMEGIAHSNILFIQLTANKGFGAGNNSAATIAQGRYLFLLNPDTRLSSNAAGIFMQFMDAAQHQQFAACGADLINEAGESVQAYGHFPTYWSAIASLGLQWIIPNYYQRYLSLGAANRGSDNKVVDYISGAALFIRKKVIDQLGLFDEDFFMFFEETEWAFRVKQAGYLLCLLPEVQIVHLEGGSEEKSPGEQVFSMPRYQLFEQSRQLFYRKTRGKFFAYCMKPFDIIQMLQKTWRGKEGGNWQEKWKIIQAA